VKILLVEDHPFLAKVSCDALREIYDHEVEYVTTAAEALKAAAHHPFDVIVLDINLPDLDGYQLAAKLREFPQLAGATFVALTGAGNLIDAEHAAASGFDACYTKPMNFDVLDKIRPKT
jgi:two-component system capsular synthesis sensor histidine kinase RcsC